MAPFLVRQLRFARAEFLRCLEGVDNEEGRQQIGQMNSISWIVGHLANHEHFLWVVAAQDKVIFPELHEVYGYGKPASSPPLDEMLDVLRQVSNYADEYLDTLNDRLLGEFLNFNEKQFRENIGTTLMRNTYHIWFHLGEVHAIRQQLGHQPPDFVGRFGEAEFKQEDLSI